MLRRLTFVVPPILFIVLLPLTLLALFMGRFVEAPVSYFFSHDCDSHQILVKSDGHITHQLIDLNTDAYHLFTGPDYIIYLEKEGCLYSVEADLQLTQILNAHIGDWITWTDDGFIYSNSRDLIKVSLNNGEQIPLTQATRRCHRPTLSPDGNLLAFVRGVTPYSDIMLMSMQTDEQRRIAQGTHPVWSPNGERLLFVDGDNVYHVYNRATDDITHLPIEYLPHIVEFGIVWMPDSDSLLYTAFDWGTLLLKTIHVETLTIQTLPVRGAKNYMPSVSPDGKHLAYVSEFGDVPMLFIMELDTHATWNTGIHIDWDTRQLAWSPDGRYITFAGKHFSQLQIIRYDSQTHRLHYGIITDEPFGDIVWQANEPPQTQTILSH